MKKKLLLTSLLSLALAGASVRADTLYWSGGGTTLGGGGTWNTTLARWGTSTSGPFTTVWNNANSDSPTLAGGSFNGGSVVLGNAITMNGTLTWQNTAGTYAAYSINGTSALTFSPGSTLNCNNSAGGGIAVGSFNAPYAGTITKTGLGFLYFNNAGGNVTKFILNQGTADFAAPSRFGSGADTADFLTFNGGTMRVETTTAWTMGRSITVNSGGGTIYSSSSAITVTQDKPIAWNSGNLTINNSTAFHFNLSSTTSSGTGTLTIQSTLTSTCNNAGVIPSGVVVSVAGTLAMNSKAQTIKSLSSSGAVTLGSATLTITNGGHTFSGVISGTGGLVKNGTGTTILSGANTYSGTTVINGGTLAFGAGTSTCSGVTTVNSSGTLRLAAAGALSSSPIVVNGGGVLDVSSQSPTITALSGSGVVSNNAYGTITVNGDLTTGGTTSGTGFPVYSCFSGSITNGGLYKTGTHAMALRGANAFDGTVGTFLIFDNGTLSVGAAPDRLPPSTSLALNSPALFQLDANTQNIASLNGNGTLNLGGGTLIDNEMGNGSFYGVVQDSELPGSSTALGHGLRGYYYNNIDMTSLGAVRDDATVNFTDLTSASQLPDAVYNVSGGTNTDSIRWLGQLLTTAAGTYTFTTTCDDGRRLWINGQLVIDSWVSGATTKSGSIALDANTKYDLVFEWFNGSGGASANLLWTPPGDTTTNVIPTDYLFLPGPGALVMGGTGTMTLGGANTYSGDTIVAAGTLYAYADGALGNGNVTVSNAYLYLQGGATNGYINPSANLSLKGNATSGMVVTLNYSGPENIGGLSFDGVAQPAGTYGPSGSGATHIDDSHFAGYGVLNVVGAPSATVLISSGSPTAVYGNPLTLTATVTPSGVTGNVTFYDGANWLGSAALNGSGVGTFSVANLQVSASPHALTAVYGGDAAHAPSTSAAVSQSTTVASLTPNVVVNNKVYDGTTTATISSATTFTGIYSGDTNYVHFSGTAVANFVDKNVGPGKTVNITGLALAGSLASNYQMSTTTASVTADITAKPLTVTGLTANNKVYDGGTNASFTGTAALSGIVSPDIVTLGGTPVASFATKTVGNAKAVTINGYTLGGADDGNYSLPAPTLTANITAAPLTVVSVTANGKVYDGTTTATLSGTAALSGVISPDDVSLGGTPVANFNNKNAGTAKPVTVTGYTVSGADTNNYTLAQPAGLTATISAVPTSCVLVSSANPSTLTSNVTFTATFTANPLPVVPDAPTGTASFTVDGIPVASPIVVSNAQGVATAVYSTTTLTVGAHTILAAYLTDGNYQACNNSLQQTVQNASSASPVTISNIVGTTLNYGGGAGSKFILLQSAAASAPMSTWTYPGQTNTATPGSFTIPAVGTGAPLFYRIQSQ